MNARASAFFAAVTFVVTEIAGAAAVQTVDALEVVRRMAGAGAVDLAVPVAQLGFDLHEAVFYSDSITDLPLLEQVGTPVAVCPDRRLRGVARARGWRIEEW